MNEKTKPASMLASLLGHEGPKSLLSVLKSKGLVEHLSVGESIVGQETSLFDITANLTDHGLKRYKEVVNIIYDSIDDFSSKEFPQVNMVLISAYL
jgi:secreted Zn-dependent insulinase-like peptidase